MLRPSLLMGVRRLSPRTRVVTADIPHAHALVWLGLHHLPDDVVAGSSHVVGQRPKGRPGRMLATTTTAATGCKQGGV